MSTKWNDEPRMMELEKRYRMLRQLGRELEKRLDERCQDMFSRIADEMPQGITVNRLYKKMGKIPKQTFYTHLKHLDKEGFIKKEKDEKSNLRFKPIVIKLSNDKWKTVLWGKTALQLFEEREKILKNKSLEETAQIIHYFWGRDVVWIMNWISEAKDDFDKAAIFDLYFYQLALELDLLWGKIKKTKKGGKRLQMALIPYLILAFVPHDPRFAKARKIIWAELNKPEYRNAAKSELKEFWQTVEKARRNLREQGVKFPGDA